jgi:MYXO-CTERM domain-containing protein
VVGLVFSANPGLTGAQARWIIEQTADKVGGAAYDALGHDDHYGFGRINAGRAVRVAARGLELGDGAPCAEDINCARGQCVRVDAGAEQGVCAVPCTGPDDCQPGQECASLGSSGISVCQDACASDAECTPPALCVPAASGNACQTLACQTALECPTDAYCPAGVCQRIPPSEGDDGGCGCGASGAPGGLALLVLAGVGLRRRR